MPPWPSISISSFVTRGTWTSFSPKSLSYWVSKNFWFCDSWQMVLWEIKTNRKEKEGNPTKPFCLRLRTCIRIRSGKGKLLSEILRTPRNPGAWKEGWALITSDGRWGTFSWCLEENAENCFIRFPFRFFFFFLTTMLFWRVGKFTLSSYDIRGRHSPQVKRLLFTHLSQTAVWWPGTVMNNNDPFHMCTALHFTKWIQTQEWGFWNQRRVLTLALPLRSCPVILPLWPSFSSAVNGVSNPYVASCKSGLSIKVYVYDDFWWTFFGCLPGIHSACSLFLFGVFM